MSATITSLKPEAPAEVPAFDLSIATNFSEGQQVQFRVPITAGTSREEANRIVDMMVDMGKRQQARAEIELLEANLADKRDALELQKTRETAAEVAYRAQIAAFEAEIKELRDEHGRTITDAEQDYHVSGRQGAYAPAGAVKSKLLRLAQAVAAKAQAAERHAAEHDQQVLQPHAEIIEKLVREISAIERLLVRNRAIIAG